LLRHEVNHAASCTSGFPAGPAPSGLQRLSFEQPIVAPRCSRSDAAQILIIRLESRTYSPNHRVPLTPPVPFLQPAAIADGRRVVGCDAPDTPAEHMSERPTSGMRLSGIRLFKGSTMLTDETPRSVIPISFSASIVGQLLGAFACFLAAFVLPANYPELRGRTASILVVIGGLLLVLGLTNLLLGRWLGKWTRRLGMRSRVVLPREGIVYLGIMLVIAVGALLGHSNMLLLVFGMMAGPFVLNGWVVVSMLHKVDVRRDVPRSASAGEFFSIGIQLANRKRWLASRLVEVRDVIEGNRMHGEASVTFVRVGPESTRSCSYQLRIARRGLFRLGPLRVSSRFPLGIGERGRAVTNHADLIVQPSIGNLLPEWRRRETSNSDAPSKSHRRRGVFDDELHNIREYRHGDNPRAIHWRTTARKGELMVREFEQQRESETTVLLDFHRTKNLTEETQELAVSLVATICHEQVAKGHSGAFALLIAGKTLAEVRSSRGSVFRQAALDALAVCQAAPKVDLAALATAACQTAASTNGCCIVVTGRSQEFWESTTETARRLLPGGFSLHGRIIVIPIQKDRMLEVFRPADELFGLRKADRPARPSGPSAETALQESLA
jgi:uncharacterized protein (DUF58 family)